MRARPAPPASALRQRPDVELCRRGELRSERFIEAAKDVFAEQGYRQARLSDIVERAGGSMSTLYRVFGDKEGLAHAIIAELMHDVSTSTDDLEHADGDPRDVIARLGRRIITTILSRESLLLHRIVVGEGQQLPALRDYYFANAVARPQAALSRYLLRETQAGRLEVASPDAAARQFFMMLFGELIMRVASGQVVAPDLEEGHAEADRAVELFLHGALPHTPTREGNALPPA